MTTRRLIAVFACGAVLALITRPAAGLPLTVEWTFENILPGVNDPPSLGDPPSPFSVPSDDSLLTATFATVSASTQFGIHDNTAIMIADSPISGNLVFGGRTNYPDDNGAYGTAALTVSFSQPIVDLGFDFIAASQDPAGGSSDEWLWVDLGPNGMWGLQSLDLNSTGYYWQWRVSPLDPLLMIGKLDVPVSSVTFRLSPQGSNSFGEFGLDNMRVTVVPEPAACVLVLSSVLPLLLVLRPRRA